MDVYPNLDPEPSRVLVIFDGEQAPCDSWCNETQRFQKEITSEIT